MTHLYLQHLCRSFCLQVLSQHDNYIFLCRQLYISIERKKSGITLKQRIQNLLYCVYPAILKGPKQLPNCLKIAETSVVINVFKGVICDISAYIVTVSFCHST